jgi:transposase
MDDIEKVRGLERQGLSRSAIAKKLGVSRPTVRKYLDRDDFSVTTPSVPVLRGSVLDSFKDWVDQVLAGDKTVRVKQRHTAQRLFDRLVAEKGYTGSYSVVQRYVKAWKAKDRVETQQGGFNDLVWPAGTAQVDFGQADFDTETGREVKHFLVVTFPHSNQGFTQVFDGETAECVCQGLLDIFIHVGGVPPVLVFDNATGVGGRIGNHVRQAESFKRFSLHHRFETRFCNPYSGHEKGSVENKVGYLRRNMFVPVPDISGLGLQRYNELLLIESADDRDHYEKNASISGLFTHDQEAMLPLPGKRFEPVRWEQYVTDKYGRVTIDGSHVYSVAPQLGGQRVWVGIGAHQIQINTLDGHLVATHARGFGKHHTEHIDQARMMTALIGKPRAWEASSLRASMAGRPGQGFIDSLPATMFNAYLTMIRDQAATHGLPQVLDALDWLVIRGTSFTPVDLGTLAWRADSTGINTPPTEGPDLTIYDQAFGVNTFQETIK